MKNIDAIEVLLALGQESRLNIFRLIVQRGEAGLTPSQLIEKLGIPNATLSFHLKELAKAKLLLVERQSRNLIYRPNPKQIENLSDFLMDNCCGANRVVLQLVRKRWCACDRIHQKQIGLLISLYPHEKIQRSLLVYP